MDFPGQLVWSLTLAVGTSSLCLSQQIRDYWIDLEGDINALDARALYNSLSSFFLSIRNARIDVWTDNVTLRATWENGGCRSSLVNQELKKIEEMSRAFEIYPIEGKHC